MRPSLALLLLLIEILIAIAYIFATQIGTTTAVSTYYNFFQDVHVMIFIGFGFLVVFLKSHAWSAVGFNYLAAAVAIQVTPLFLGFWNNVITKPAVQTITIDITSLYNAEFGAAAVLITLGSVIGKVSDFQLAFIAIFESFFYALNVQLSSQVFNISDVGGSIVIHAFGGFFGIALSIALSNPKSGSAPNAKDGYINDTLAFIGTIFLFLYWPSFNAVSVSAPATAVQQNYIVPNTYFAIAASVLAAFTLSSLYNKGKLRIEDILNASLAGGVIIGANSNLTADIGTAILIGLLGGVISTVGFNKLTPALSDSGFLHDTAGVTNLHALPGLFGGLISAILANNLSGTTAISGQLQNIFPAEFNIIHRSPSTQASYQFAFTLFTVALALVSGYVAGLLLRAHFWVASSDLNRLFIDKEYWVITQKDYSQESEEGTLIAKQLTQQPSTTVVAQVLSPVPVPDFTQSRRAVIPVQAYQYNVEVKKSNWLDNPAAAQRDIELAYSGHTEI